MAVGQIAGLMGHYQAGLGVGAAICVTPAVTVTTPGVCTAQCRQSQLSPAGHLLSSPGIVPRTGHRASFIIIDLRTANIPAHRLQPDRRVDVYILLSLTDFVNPTFIFR